ncbi:protein translocase subunit SecDF [Flavobacterium sp. F372]|uniref:Multifunctional fusion protein n=1 Tax=Flavobacterium bernardetii TaxID=2813823 RepID=A0ABR7J1U5_9FLAO|nr:protein translocase subunit SecDF [Flavobacterium bernardetii]MBC5836039.1 protein translocase subunit SecDF [Flavobacterium bernardetii]NHF71221.1 protein translocase subunit SecDF [Flavobacterium bernardetii]
MQNKGLIKFFAIIFTIACIYQLSFTFVANGIVKDAKEFAKGDSQKELNYLKSLKKKEVLNLGFASFTYEEIEKQQINKGLDLEGGINVTVEVSVKDVLKTLSNNSKDPIFNRALTRATEEREGNQDYLDAFFEAFNKESKGILKLASPEVFYNRNLSDEIQSNMSDDQVKVILKRKVAESIESAYKVLTKRIDKFGVAQPNIQKIGETGRILVELPGAKDLDRIEKLISGTAQLEFWETLRPEELGNFFTAANEALRVTEKKAVTKKVATVDTTKAVDSKSKVNDLLADKKDPAKKDAKDLGPLFEKAIAGPSGLYAYNVKDTAKINSYLKRSEIKALLPATASYAKFAWGKTNEKLGDIVELYILKGTSDGIAPLLGGAVTDASADFDQFGKPAVSMQMNPVGSRKWEQLTGDIAKKGNQVCIVLDNIVYSAATAKAAISGGQTQISGSFTLEETADLENVLRAGKLPAKAEIVQKAVVGPSLGQEAIDNGILSSLIGLLLVSFWMVFYYGRAGWYANVALLLNLVLLFGAMANFGFVLTLPGIAGIVLTMGTAVDANIIIYERAKEELRAGLSLEESVKNAFGWKGAMRSIIDANVTHVLTGAILYIFGEGMIRGFAITLLIGILTSLFTSIFIARFFIDADIAKGRSLQFSTNITKNWFTGFNFDFLRIKKFTYIFSLTVCVISFVSFYVNGFDQGIDFVGGRTFQVQFDQKVSSEEVSNALSTAEYFEKAEAKTFGNDKQLKITTKYMIDKQGVEVDKAVNVKLYNGLKKFFAKEITYKQFTNTEEGKKIGVLQAMKVGPSIADDIKTNAYWAVLGAMLLVCLYLVISFRKYQYSLGAIAAVAHDVIFVLGIYSLLYKYMPFHMEIDQHFIAAILTVIGYSMNDTVIVFDRVREFLGIRSHHGNFNQIVNDSINTTLSRTLNTSLTMILVLSIMFVFGGDSIRGFIFAMLIGIIVGTYSSLFIATPVLVDTMTKYDKTIVEQEHNS